MTSFVKKLKQRWLPRYHRELFRWHCQQFFAWERVLLPCEQTYLELCFQQAEDYTQDVSSTHQHDSYYSYRHRVKNRDVNSSGLMYGSVKFCPALWQATEVVLRERGINLPADLIPSDKQSERDPFWFCGLGWDGLENQIEIHFRTQIAWCERRPVWKTLWPTTSLEHREVGTIQLVFQEGALWDEQLFLRLPTTGAGLWYTPQTRGLMLSSRRGMITPYEKVNVQVWESQLNPEGQRILHQYRKYMTIPGSVSFHDANHFTLMFP